MLRNLLPILLCFQVHASFLDWFSAAPSPAASEAEDSLAKIDAVIEQARKEYEVPGLAIGVVVDGRVVYLKGFGVKDIETNSPVDENTLFRIGSCTKAFTSFLMGTLIDEGKMSWDERVVDVLPDFRLYTQNATQNLTFRDLLAHRSGVPRHDFMWYNSSMSRAEVMSRLRYLEPSSDIREGYHYNNLMYLTAGYAMQQITGKSWEELVFERILQPLGMARTNFSPEEMQELSNCALPYVERGGVLKRMSFRNLLPIGPAASINSSVADLVKWIALLLDKGSYNGKTLVSPGVLQDMHLPQAVMNETPETKEMQFCSAGMGWRLCSYRGNYLVHHDGGVDGYVSQISLLPYSRVGLVILSNRNLTPLPLVLSLEILDIVTRLPRIDWIQEGKDRLQKMKEGLILEKKAMEKQRRPNTIPSHSLEEYAGEYVHPGYGKIQVEVKEGKMSASFNGITSYLDHWHYDVFYVSEESEDLILDREGMKFTFRTNVQGDVEELAIPFEANTKDIVFKRSVKDVFTERSYLHRFTGFYEVYGHSIEVSLRGDQLIAVLHGQAPYELIPVHENEFSVRSLPGASIRFLMNAWGGVEEVWVTKPPYPPFMAKPVR